MWHTILRLTAAVDAKAPHIVQAQRSITRSSRRKNSGHINKNHQQVQGKTMRLKQSNSTPTAPANRLSIKHPFVPVDVVRAAHCCPWMPCSNSTIAWNRRTVRKYISGEKIRYVRTAACCMRRSKVQKFQVVPYRSTPFETI